MAYVVDVLLPIVVNQPFSYDASAFADKLRLGDWVQVTFRGKPQVGVVWEISDHVPQRTLNPILKKLDFPPLPERLRRFITRVAHYNIIPLGQVLKLSFNKEYLVEKSFRKKIDLTPCRLQQNVVDLSAEQQGALEGIRLSVAKKGFQPILLDGVTGSGKTEVYLAVIEDALLRGKQALILLPEIALTDQWLDRFQRRFGVFPLQWHSSMGAGIRQQTWQACLHDQAQVVVGARSALYLPLSRLEVIVVDEEHDGSFKQAEQGIYQARDMAVLRAHTEDCAIILASATPSLETYHNAQEGRYQHVRLTQRHAGAAMPSTEIIDMRTQPRGWLSPRLISVMQETLNRQEQVLLFLNRRGYAPLTVCKDCGYHITCQNCYAALVEHRQQGARCCHHCGFQQPMTASCPECGEEDSLVPCGPGVERIHEVVEKFFPSASVGVMTRDYMTTPEKLHDLLQRIHQQKIDILIGTQMLAKGHHFPRMTLVGVVDADLGLFGSDLRASERTYQLLHQVAGRAGREQRPGHVMFQSFQPNNPVLQAIAQGDRDTFFALELQQRQQHGLPPFQRLVSVILSAGQEQEAMQAAWHLARHIPNHLHYEVLGPAPAPLKLLRGQFRWQLLIKFDKKIAFQSCIHTWIQSIASFKRVKCVVDVDPYAFV